MAGRRAHYSTILLALFALVSVVLALAAVNGLLDPVVEILSR